MERKKPGPVPKGVRRQFTLRVPEEQFDVYQRAATQQGLSLGDYLAGVLARGHGMPDPEYLHRSRRRDSDMLPLTG